MRSIYKPICLPLRRAASLLFFLAFQFSSSAQAACPSLLVIDNPAALHPLAGRWRQTTETGSLVITGLNPGDKTEVTPACRMVFSRS